MKKKILICTDWFTPAFRAGGPIRSVDNLARLLCHDADIYIYTGDRDLNDTASFEGITLNEWVDYEPGIKVYYTTPENQTRQHFRELVKKIRPDALYINSMFSKNFAIQPVMESRRLKGIKIVVSPRGMLRSSALAYKWLKKKLFLFTARMSKIFGHVYFHATDEQEVTDIRERINAEAPVTCIHNVPAAPDAAIQFIEKKPGALNIIFTGRIHPIKNLHLLLEALHPVKSEVHCTLVGVMEDKAYWKRCEQIIKRLPANISVAPPVEETPAKLAERTRLHHLYVLPTQGENFGHAIFEAMCCGRPVLISDQTPWRNLEQKKAGWDLPLDNLQALTEKIEAVAGMNQQEWESWCTAAHELACSVFNDATVKEKYLELFS